MTATVIATFSSTIHARKALDALADAGFVEESGVWMATVPQPTIEVRGPMKAVERALGIMQDHAPMSIEEDCQSMPLEGYDVDSSAHTQNAKTAAEQWRARRAELADEPLTWAEARKQVRYGGQRPGQDGYSGATGAGFGSSMRDRYVSVRDDQGPRTLTGNGGGE